MITFQKLIGTEPIINLDKNGKLINAKIEDVAHNYPFILLNERQLCDYEMLHNKSFYPLEGFMTNDEYISCVNNMSLPDGTIWPIPITLHVTEKWINDNLVNKNLMKQNNYTLEDLIQSKKKFKDCLISGYTILKHETGLPLAIMKNENIFKPDLFSESKHVFDAITDNEIDTNHPYVKILSDYKNEGMIYCLGGKFISSNDVPHYDFTEYRMDSITLKNKLIEQGWISNNGEALNNIVAFQTRNPLHRSHFELTKKSLRDASKKNSKNSNVK